MEKQILMNDVYHKLYQSGIGCTQSENTDLVIHCEFLDAGFSTGKKRIEYDAEAYFDETSQTIFLWEMTKEQGSGFSFGADSESSFQSGKTLYRKVKNVQYGPDGKVYEYSLDLGAIPKAFKETAKSHGWKCKTVINNEKARYPKGFTPLIQPGLYRVTPEPQTQQNTYQQYQQPKYQQPQNQQTQTTVLQYQQYSNQNGNFYSNNQPQQKDKKGFPFWISLLPVVIITFAMFLYAEVTLLGYIIGGLFLLVLFLLSKKLRRVGCIFQIIIWIVSIIILFLIFSFNLPS